MFLFSRDGSSWIYLSAKKAKALCPEERGAERFRKMLSRWLTLPPEAFFYLIYRMPSPWVTVPMV